MGRPHNPRQNLWSADWSLEKQEDISSKIATELDIPKGALSDELAYRAAIYLSMEELQRKAPLIVKRKGNRPKIHLADLLRSCALALQAHTGADAKNELSRIGERTEKTSEVVRCAVAVLTALGIRHPFSLRQQAKQAIKLL